METSPPTCARHPDVETRLSCSSCGTAICPDCGREAAVGYKCPDCATHLEGTTTPRPTAGRSFGLFGAGWGRGTSAGDTDGEPATSTGPDEPLPQRLGARATVVGLVAAVFGGAVLAPVLQGGAFFLLTSGLVGWGVARTVYWTTAERNSPYVRALALTAAGFAVAVALGIAASWTGGRGGEIVFLAYPAAVYGGWIVVRQR